MTGTAARLDDSEYLTADEFAALPTDAQIAVWTAQAQGRVRSVVSGSGGISRYSRADVAALLGQEAGHA